MKSLRMLIALGTMSSLVLGCGATPGTAPLGQGTTTGSSGDAAGATDGSANGGTTIGGTGTGGTTAGGGTTALVTGIALPQEVSALPPKAQTSTGTSSLLTRTRSFLRLGSALTASSLPAGSDYATTATVKWVNEQALSRFDILNSIFKAVGQTHYADAENVGTGPYGALVTAVGDGDKGQQKSLQSWVVSSTMTKDPDGRDVNVVHAWIDDEGGTIPVEMKIYAAPTQNADGSYANYGVWSINADLSPDGAQYFVATAEVANDGGSVVKVHNTDGGGGGKGGPFETRGILHKSASVGYGKVSFPNWNACSSPNCTPATMTVAYAYDAHHVKMEMSSGGATQTLVKDRDAVIDLVQRYGLYDAMGNDVAKTHHFGFPVTNGSGMGGYYGAWQGHHQIWANGGTVAPGTVLTRADRAPNEAAETYTASPVFQGVLVQRTYTAASLDDVKDVAVNTWDFQNFLLQGDGTAWHRCTMTQPQPGQPGQPPVCETAPFTDFVALVMAPGSQGNVMITGFVNPPPSPGSPPPAPLQGPQPQLAVSPTGNGFVYQGSQTAFPPVNGANVNVNVGGPIWIVWNGTSWQKKQVVSVDAYMQPTFGSTSTPYTMPDGRELHLNNMGVNYVVQCTGGSCTVKLETQYVANPANITKDARWANLATTTFSGNSCGQTPSTFQFVTDPGSPKFMKLVYASVGQDCGPTSSSTAPKVGEVVTAGQWGMSVTVGGVTTQYNWDYPDQNNTCQGCGTQQFLIDGDGKLVQLDDPVRFTAVGLDDGGGEHHTYALQFDGSWVSGLPDLHSDLAQSNGEVTPAIAARYVNIPDGTVVTDATDSSIQYVFKQLEIAEYLETVADPGGLDLALAKLLDLSTVPTWAATGLGAKPKAVLQYSEGTKVQ